MNSRELTLSPEILEMLRDVEFEQLDNVDAGSFEFSEGFNSWFESLVSEESEFSAVENTGSARRPLWRRIVMILVAVLGLFCATMIVSAEFRGLVLSQIRTILDDSSYYDFSSDESAGDESLQFPELNINWLPMGFELVDDWGSPFSMHKQYRNIDTGDIVWFDYTLLDTDMEIGYDWTGGVYETVYINGLEADFYPANSKSSQNNLVWIDKSLGVVITMDTTLSKEDIIKMAESIYQ